MKTARNLSTILLSICSVILLAPGSIRYRKPFMQDIRGSREAASLSKYIMYQVSLKRICRMVVGTLTAKNCIEESSGLVSFLGND